MEPFRIRPEYTDAELDMLAARQSGLDDALSLPVLLGGGALSLACALVAEAAGAAKPRNGLIVLLLLGCFLAGCVAPVLAALVERRWHRTRRRAEQRRDLAGLELRVMPHGIAARRPGSLLVLRWHEVQMADYRDGLVLLHTDCGVLLGLPDRLLTPEQRSAVLDRTEPLDDLF